jgi:hypothetical protein
VATQETSTVVVHHFEANTVQKSWLKVEFCHVFFDHPKGYGHQPNLTEERTRKQLDFSAITSDRFNGRRPRHFRQGDGVR